MFINVLYILCVYEIWIVCTISLLSTCMTTKFRSILAFTSLLYIVFSPNYQKTLEAEETAQQLRALVTVQRTQVRFPAPTSGNSE